MIKILFNLHVSYMAVCYTSHYASLRDSGTYYPGRTGSWSCKSAVESAIHIAVMATSIAADEAAEPPPPPPPPPLCSLRSAT